MSFKPEDITVQQVPGFNFLKSFTVTPNDGSFSREVVVPKGQNAIMVLAVRYDSVYSVWKAVLIRENLQPGRFMATGEPSGLTFPKGLLDEGENAMEAGVREIGEEAGYSVSTVVNIPDSPLIAAPGFLAHQTHMAIAILGKRNVTKEGDEEKGAIDVEEHNLCNVLNGSLFQGDARHLALVWNPTTKQILEKIGVTW